jgi:uncharacterized protein involved in outer membrane biogenesis
MPGPSSLVSLSVVSLSVASLSVASLSPSAATPWAQAASGASPATDRRSGPSRTRSDGSSIEVQRIAIAPGRDVERRGRGP